MLNKRQHRLFANKQFVRIFIVYFKKNEQKLLCLFASWIISFKIIHITVL